MNATDKKIFRVSQLPQILPLGETSIRKEIKAGNLRAVRLRGCLVVTQEALADYIAALPEAQ